MITCYQPERCRAPWGNCVLRRDRTAGLSAPLLRRGALLRCAPDSFLDEGPNILATTKLPASLRSRKLFAFGRNAGRVPPESAFPSRNPQIHKDQIRCLALWSLCGDLSELRHPALPIRKKSVNPHGRKHISQECWRAKRHRSFRKVRAWPCGEV